MQFGCEKCGKGIYNKNITKMGKAGLSCDHCGHRRIKFISWPKTWIDAINTGAQIV